MTVGTENREAQLEKPVRVRLSGIDAARGLALIGMFIAHAVPDGGFWETLTFEVASERSRLLFALTAGLGLGLLTGGVRPPGPREGRWSLRRQIAIRGLCLLLLGALLTILGPLVYVILDEYGVAFLVMVALVFLPARWLLAVGSVGVVLMPGVAVWAAATPEVQEAVDGRWSLLVDWAITGAYPVIIWVPVIMVGVGLVRLGLDRARVVLVAGGIAVVLAIAGLSVAPLFASADEIVAGESARGIAPVAVATSLTVLGNVAVGLVVVMALVALTTFAGRGIRRVAGIVLSPLAAAGSMPLTVYTVQLIVLRATIRIEDGVATDDSWLTVLLLTVGSLLGAWLWRRYIGRGPLEFVIGLVSGRVKLKLPAWME